MVSPAAFARKAKAIALLVFDVDRSTSFGAARDMVVQALGHAR